jgi:hypothetical protein
LPNYAEPHHFGKHCPRGYVTAVRLNQPRETACFSVEWENVASPGPARIPEISQPTAHNLRDAMLWFRIRVFVACSQDS